MNATVLLLITILLIVIVVVILTAAPVSERLVRACARRLPKDLAHRMEEEWRAELNVLPSGLARLAFAVALMLTRRRSFAMPGEDLMAVTHDRLGSFVFGGWKSLLLIPTVVFALAAYGASFLLPLRYQSEALLLAERSYLSTALPPVISQPSFEEQFERARLQIESPRNLLFLVYGNQSTDTDEDLTQQIRDDITIRFVPVQAGGQSASITIQYVGYDPITAQQVSQKLVNLMSATFSYAQEERLLGASRFFESQLSAMAKRLTEHGNRLARDRGADGPGEGDRLALDYELLKAEYGKVFSQREQLQTLIEMASRGRGVLTVLELPGPGKLVGPNRLAITAVGAFAGLAVGGMAAVGLYRKKQRRLLA